MTTNYNLVNPVALEVGQTNNYGAVSGAPEAVPPWIPGEVDQLASNLPAKERLRIIGEWFKKNPYSRALTFLRTLVPDSAPVIAFSYPLGCAAPFDYWEMPTVPSIEETVLSYPGPEFGENANEDAGVALLPEVFFMALQPRDIRYSTQATAMYIIAEDGSLWTYGYGPSYDGTYGSGTDSHMDPDAINLPQDQTWMERQFTYAASRSYLSCVHEGPFVGFESGDSYKWFLRHEDGSLWSDAHGKVRAYVGEGYDRSTYGIPALSSAEGIAQNTGWPTSHGDPIALVDPDNDTAPVSYAATPLGLRSLGPTMSDSIDKVFSFGDTTYAITKSGRLVVWGFVFTVPLDYDFMTACAMREFGEVVNPWECHLGVPLYLELPKGEAAVHVSHYGNRTMVVTDLGRVYGLGECFDDSWRWSNRFGWRVLPYSLEKNGQYAGPHSWILLYDPTEHETVLHVSRLEITDEDNVILQYAEVPHVWYGFGNRAAAIKGIGLYDMRQPLPLTSETATWSKLTQKGALFWNDTDTMLRFVAVNGDIYDQDAHYINSVMEDATKPEVRLVLMYGDPVKNATDVWCIQSGILLVEAERSSVPKFDAITSMDIVSYCQGSDEVMEFSGYWVTETYDQVGRMSVSNRYMAPFFDVEETHKTVTSLCVREDLLEFAEKYVDRHAVLATASESFEIDFISSLIVLGRYATPVQTRFGVDAPLLYDTLHTGLWHSVGLLLENKTYATAFHTNSSPRVPFTLPYRSHYRRVAPIPQYNEVFAFYLAKNNAMSGIGRLPAAVATNFTAWGARTVTAEAGVAIPFTDQGDAGLMQYTGEGIRQLLSARCMTNLGQAFAIDKDHVARLVLPSESWNSFFKYYQNNMIGAFYPGLDGVRAIYPAGAEQQGLIALMLDGSVHVWYAALMSKGSKATYYADPSYEFVKAGVGLNQWNNNYPQTMILLSAAGKIYAVGSNNLRWFYNGALVISNMASNESLYVVPPPADASKWIDIMPAGSIGNAIVESCAMDDKGRLYALGASGPLVDTYLAYQNPGLSPSAANTPKTLIDTDVREAKVWYEEPYGSASLINLSRYTVAYLKKGQLHVKGSNPRWTGRYDHTVFKLAMEGNNDVCVFRRLPFGTEAQQEALASLYLSQGITQASPMIAFGSSLVAPRLAVSGKLYATGSNPTIGWPVMDEFGLRMEPMPLTCPYPDDVGPAHSGYTSPCFPLALPGSGGLFASAGGQFVVPGVMSFTPHWFDQLHVWEFTDEGHIEGPYRVDTPASKLTLDEYQQYAFVRVVGGCKNDNGTWTLLVDQSWYDRGVGQPKQRILAMNFSVDKQAKVVTLIYLEVLRSRITPSQNGDQNQWHNEVRPMCRVGATKVFAYGKHIFASATGVTWSAYTTSLPWDDESASGTLPSSVFSSTYANAYARTVCGLYAISDTELVVMIGDATLWKVAVGDMGDISAWTLIGQPSYMDATYPNTVTGMGARWRYDAPQYPKGIASFWQVGTTLYAHLPNPSSSYNSATLAWDIGASRLTKWLVGSAPYNVCSLDGYGVFGPFGNIVAGDITGVWAEYGSYAYAMANYSLVASVSYHPTLGIFMALRDTTFRTHSVFDHPVPGRQFIGIEETLTGHSTISWGARRVLVLTDDTNSVWHVGGWSGSADYLFPEASQYPDTPSCQNGTFNRVFIKPQYIGNLDYALGVEVAQVMPQYGYMGGGTPNGYVLLASNSKQRKAIDTRYSVSVLNVQTSSIRQAHSVFAIDFKNETHGAYYQSDHAVLENKLVTSRNSSVLYDLVKQARYYLHDADGPVLCSSVSISTTLKKADMGVGIPCTVRSATVVDPIAFSGSAWATSVAADEVKIGSSVKYLPISIYFQLAKNTRLAVSIGLRTASVATVDGVEWWLGTDYLSASFTFAGIRIVVDFGVFPDAATLFSAYAAHTARNSSYWRVRRLDCYLRIDGAVGSDLMRAHTNVPKSSNLVAEMDELITFRARERSSLSPSTTVSANSTDIAITSVESGTDKDTSLKIDAAISATIDGEKIVNVHGEMVWDCTIQNILPDTTYLHADLLDGEYNAGQIISEVLPNRMWMGVDDQLIGWLSNDSIVMLSLIYASTDAKNWRVWIDTSDGEHPAVRQRFPAVRRQDCVVLTSLFNNGLSATTVRTYTPQPNGDIAVVSGEVSVHPVGVYELSYNLPILTDGTKQVMTVARGTYSNWTLGFTLLDYSNILSINAKAYWMDTPTNILSFPWARTGVSLPHWMRSGVLYPNVAYLNADQMLARGRYGRGPGYLDKTQEQEYNNINEAYSYGQSGATWVEGTSVACHKVRTIGNSVWRLYDGRGSISMAIARHALYPSVLGGFQQVYKDTPAGKYVYMETAPELSSGGRAVVWSGLARIPDAVVTKPNGDSANVYVSSVMVDVADNDPTATVITIHVNGMYSPGGNTGSEAALVIIEREGKPTVSYWLVGHTSISSLQYEAPHRKVLVLPSGVAYGVPHHVTKTTENGVTTRTPDQIQYNARSRWVYFNYNGTINGRYIHGNETSTYDPDGLRLVVFPPLQVLWALDNAFFFRTYGYEVTPSADAYATAVMPTKAHGKFEIDFKLHAKFDDLDVQTYSFRNVYQQLTDFGRTVTGEVVCAANGAVAAMEVRRNVWLASADITAGGTFSVAVPPSSERIYLVAITDQGEVCRILLEE